MITFSKSVTELQCFKDVDGVQDLVHTVIWTLVGTSENTPGGELFVETFGMRTEVPNLPSTEFTPFDSLDEQTVLGWIDLYTPAQRLAAAEQYITNAIDERKTQAYRTPPWFVNTQGD